MLTELPSTRPMKNSRAETLLAAMSKRGSSVLTSGISSDDPAGIKAERTSCGGGGASLSSAETSGAFKAC